uniref:Uncharacterized protein n=1 Tax=Arundo donax TaxID=35708 RepID=A0A0A9CS07_ARUDO
MWLPPNLACTRVALLFLNEHLTIVCSSCCNNMSQSFCFFPLASFSDIISFSPPDPHQSAD